MLAIPIIWGMIAASQLFNGRTAAPGSRAIRNPLRRHAVHLLSNSYRVDENLPIDLGPQKNMPGERWNGNSEEWQQLILSLLKVRYPLGEFVEIPDSVGGDCGLEGFGRDGIGFQCYAVEGEPLPTDQLTQRQKRKIRNDLNKLRVNALPLGSILGTTVLRRWLLVVPRWLDKDLQAYAEERAEVLRQAGLVFIAADFEPSIVTLEEFVVERQKLGLARSESLRIQAEEPQEQDVRDWVGENDELIANLDRKLLIVCGGRTSEALKLRNRFLSHYLEGRNLLEKMKNQYPPLYESIYRIKEEREHFLETESLIPYSLPPERMKETLADFACQLRSTLPGLSPFNVEQLVHEAISDWLLRCPLDFPQEAE